MPLLGINNLKKSYVTRVLFEGISFEVENGDHIGFVGVNGCGKSTLFRIILGEEPADEGAVMLSGEAKLGSMQQKVSNDDLPLYDYTLEVFSELMQIEEKRPHPFRKVHFIRLHMGSQTGYRGCTQGPLPDSFTGYDK